MQLGSSAFANDATIPRRFTCDGEDLSPPLDWTGAPERPTAWSCDDPDAPGGDTRRPMTLRPTVRDLRKALPATPTGKASGRLSTTFTDRVTAVPAHLAASRSPGIISLQYEVLSSGTISP